MLLSAHKGGRGREAQLKEAVSRSCHNDVLKTPLTQGATEATSRQQCLSVQQQAAGGEQCLGKPSGCAHQGGREGREFLGTRCATPVSLRDGVGRVRDDT